MSNIAVINLAGAQYLVKPGDKFEVNKLSNEVNDSFNPEVLLSTDGDKVLFNDGKVETKVTEQKKGEKLYILKFKAKSRYRRRTGHRQLLSVLEVVSINGEKASTKTKEAKVTKTSEEKIKVVEKKVSTKKTTATKKPTTSKTKKVAKKSEK